MDGEPWGCVPEVGYGRSRHALDPTMICYYRDAQGAIASVADLRAGVKAWYEANPGILGDVEKIKAFAWRIACATKPMLRSIVLERAP